jgi:uncharacterized protein YggE
MNTTPIVGRITATGIATLTVPPDTLELQAKLTSTNPVPANAIRELARETNRLKHALETAGIDNAPVTVDRFSVSETTRRTKTGNYEHTGHEACTTLTLRTPAHPNALPALMKAVALSKTDPDLTVRYSLADEEAFTANLLLAATRDAISKARVIASATEQSIAHLIEAHDERSGQMNMRFSVVRSLNAPIGDCDSTELGDLAFWDAEAITVMQIVYCTFALVSPAA